MKRILAALGALALLTGCTGVPSSSAPETVEAIAQGNPGDAVSIVPPLNADPRTIVSTFLDANATDPSNHAGARAFLTAAAQNRWSDETATIVDAAAVGTYNATSHTLKVSGREVGTLDGHGIFTPSLQGDGTGGDRVQFTFRLRTVHGQYRIDSLRSGLILTNDQFRADYQPHEVYFYDDAQRYLVPDPRYTALESRGPLANWLLAQLVAGPSPGLATAVTTDTMPAPALPGRVTATLGSLTTVTIPGASQLDPDVRDRLAAQVAETLLDTVSGLPMAILDGATPVEIPSVHGTQFSASDFTDTEPPLPAADVYYLSGGHVHNEDGRPVSGPLGDGNYFLDSVAVRRVGATGPLIVAGVEGTGDDGRLMIGTLSAGLQPTKVHGLLSRPAFAPGPPSRREVWIGVGSTLDRVTIDGTHTRVSKVSVPAVSGGGRIVAVRLSPEGARIAIVVAGTNGSAQLYVGAIVRGAGDVRIDSLQAISPQGVVITDVAWLDSLQLLAIGYLASTQDSRAFETGLDGSGWTARPMGNLSVAPDSLTVAPSALAWVSANGFVWVQSGSQWVSPGSLGQQPGRDPVYLS